MAVKFSDMIPTLTKQFSVLLTDNFLAIFLGLSPFVAVLIVSFLVLALRCCILYPYRGLSEDELKKVPKIKGHQLLLQSDCCVCLTSIESEDEAQLLPGCNHGFHSHCIGTWLSMRPFCPLCRSNVRLEVQDHCPV